MRTRHEILEDLLSCAKSINECYSKDKTKQDEAEKNFLHLFGELCSYLYKEDTTGDTKEQLDAYRKCANDIKKILNDIPDNKLGIRMVIPKEFLR